MSQTYSDPHALAWLREGKCPECGAVTDVHGGWGGPNCSLTDGGVADRIAHQRLIDAGEAAR